MDEIQRRYDNEEITYEQAVCADDIAYERYVIDPIINDLTDEFDESTALSRHIYDNYETKIRKLKYERRKVIDQIKALEQSYNTAKKDDKTKASIEARINMLRRKVRELEGDIDKVYDDRLPIDTKYNGELKYNMGKGAKKNVREEYNTEPAAAPRKPGLYKKIQDNK